jgi:general nucleoside transport system permease protein
VTACRCYGSCPSPLSMLSGLILFFLLGSDFFIVYRLKLSERCAMVEILLDATVRAGTPILFATLGAILNERAGIINLGIEGLMLIGALAGFAGTFFSGSLLIGVLAPLPPPLAGSIHALITVQLRGNQIVSGLALTMFGIGVTALFGRGMVGQTIAGLEAHRHSRPVAAAGGRPGLFQQDLLIYTSFFLVFSALVFSLSYAHRSESRTVGENPAAADTCGISVSLYRFPG